MSEIVLEKKDRRAVPSNPPLNDYTPERQIELRYQNTVDQLLDDEQANKSTHILVNVLTAVLASIAVYGSGWIPGDVVRQLGQHMRRQAERRLAHEESEKAKEEGHRPH